MKIKNLFSYENLAVWIVISSFGPYVFANFGIRTEHLLIYLLFIFGVPILALNKRPVFYSPPLFFTFVLLLMLLTLTFCSTMFGYNYLIGNTTIGKIISHTEKYIRPLAIIISLSAFFRISKEGAFRKTLINVSKALVCMLAINSILVIAQLFFDLSSVLALFTYGIESNSSPNASIHSVAELSLQMGRFSGIFNQVTESGMTYTLGLFAWAYLNSLAKRDGFAHVLNYILLGLLFVGGFFSISKMFLFGGIPLFIIYLIMINKHAHVLNFKLFFIMGVGMGIIGYFLFRSKIFYSLYYLIDIINNPSIQGITGGRFNNPETGGVMKQFQYVWDQEPFYGLGFGVYYCLDNGYLEFFTQGGLVCLIGYIILLISMALMSLKHLNTAEGRLLMFIAIYCMGAAVGISPLTANRFSPIAWIFIVLIYFVFYSDKKPMRSERALL